MKNNPWSWEDHKMCEEAGLKFILAEEGFIWPYSEVKYGVKVVLKKPDPGYADGYVVKAFNLDGESSRSHKYYKKLPVALLEFGRWQGRMQNANLVRKKLAATRDAIDGCLTFSFSE